MAWAAVLLAGCADGSTYHLGGAFTDDRTEEDMEDFQDTVAPYSSDVAIMESFPEQFAIGSLGAHDCPELRALLEAKAYIASVGDCLRESTVGDGPDQDQAGPYAS